MRVASYVLKGNEEFDEVKPKKQSKTKSVGWSVFYFITVLSVALNLFLYQELENTMAEYLLIVAYIKLTFPRKKTSARIFIWVVISLLLGLSLIVGDNILFGNFLFPIIWMPFYLWAVFSQETEKVFRPFEIQFYDDHLIVYKEKYRSSPFTIRKEINKIYYEGIDRCRYVVRHNKFTIMGKGEFTCYNYNKDGSLPDSPSRHLTDVGFAHLTPHNVDIVAEIEKNSPLTVEVDSKVY